MIHAIIMIKYHKYPSTTITEHAKVLAKVSKFSYALLSKMTTYKIFIVLQYTHAK